MSLYLPMFSIKKPPLLYQMYMIIFTWKNKDTKKSIDKTQNLSGKESST